MRSRIRAPKIVSVAWGRDWTIEHHRNEGFVVVYGGNRYDTYADVTVALKESHRLARLALSLNADCCPGCDGVVHPLKSCPAIGALLFAA